VGAVGTNVGDSAMGRDVDCAVTPYLISYISNKSMKTSSMSLVVR
jgi:hypothetical protein